MTAKATPQLIDRQQQRQILKRFLQITLGRLARIRLDLSKEQQLFLDALPILLHSNHPEFPCFVSQHTPAGICRYQPSGAEIQRIQRLLPGYVAPKEKNPEQILGVYLSGDCGTIIESAQQNIIVWVCHRDNLASNEIFQLDRKCRLIEDWASQLNMHVTMRVVDSNFESPDQKEAYRGIAKKPIFLELDRLYRSGIMVAGRMPLWWIVPPQEESRYQQYSSLLMHKKFILAEEVIDFGPIPTIPAHEFVNLCIDQLELSDSNPYQTCISQLLTEIYINEFPNSKVLGNQFKEAVYNNALDLDALDPFVMVYRRIEHYLNDRLERNRLDLIRRCFYYQVGKELSQHTKNVTWQRKQMLALVEEWGWNKDRLKELDTRDQWPATKVKAEHAELMQEISASFRFLAGFARQHRAETFSSVEEMNLLGKKLYAKFEHKAGKIDLINHGISKDLSEENLYLSQMKHRNKTVWAVYAEPISHRETPNTLPLSRSESLIELLTWCCFNGLIDDKTRFDILTGDHDLKAPELKQLLGAIRESMANNTALLNPDRESFNRPARPLSLDVFVNVASNPIEEMKKRKNSPLGITNVFDYGNSKNNLILNIETVSINSWGEIISKKFEGNITLLNFISDYIQMIPPGSGRALPTINLYSFCYQQGEAITARLKELFRDINACFYGSKLPPNTRYVLQMKTQFFIIQYQDNETHFKGARNKQDLIKRLSQNQKLYSPIVFDRHALENEALPAIVSTMQPDSIHVYFEIHENHSATIYVIDEKGSLLSFDKEFNEKDKFLKQFESFLYASLFRQNTAISSEHGSSSNSYYLDIPILFFNIEKSDDLATPKIRPYKLLADNSSRQSMHIFATAEHGANNSTVFNIYCGQHEFLAVDWGEELYSTVARFILAQRRSRSRHNCYISDLDLSRIKTLDGFEVQTSDYIYYKQIIEQLIDVSLQTA